uniref:CSON014763 protein n=1 Tax=Culicoides sonorensis TaxID=179676 RepID=A0A336MBX3_CULSO
MKIIHNFFFFKFDVLKHRYLNVEVPDKEEAARSLYSLILFRLCSYRRVAARFGRFTGYIGLGLGPLLKLNVLFDFDELFVGVGVVFLKRSFSGRLLVIKSKGCGHVVINSFFAVEKLLFEVLFVLEDKILDFFVFRFRLGRFVD